MVQVFEDVERIDECLECFDYSKIANSLGSVETEIVSNLVKAITIGENQSIRIFSNSDRAFIEIDSGIICLDGHKFSYESGKIPISHGSLIYGNTDSIFFVSNKEYIILPNNDFWDLIDAIKKLEVEERTQIADFIYYFQEERIQIETSETIDTIFEIHVVNYITDIFDKIREYRRDKQKLPLSNVELDILRLGLKKLSAQFKLHQFDGLGISARDRKLIRISAISFGYSTKQFATEKGIQFAHNGFPLSPSALSERKKMIKCSTGESLLVHEARESMRLGITEKIINRLVTKTGGFNGITTSQIELLTSIIVLRAPSMKILADAFKVRDDTLRQKLHLINDILIHGDRSYGALKEYIHKIEEELIVELEN